jgi:hypothetical protein
LLDRWATSSVTALGSMSVSANSVMGECATTWTGQMEAFHSAASSMASRDGSFR